VIRRQVINAFGGNFKELIVGGAALNKEVEDFLHAIRFPYTVGYGMTEAGPILAYDGWATFRAGSCGKAVARMALRIDSPDPARVPGEILAKGDNIMTGYYKNEEATRAAFTPDGWLRTGDLGLLDADGYLYIKGRCKNMILGPSGQNIYPEEIEDRLNTMPYVSEAIVIERDKKLVALVVPDADALANDEKNTPDDINKIMEENRRMINQHLPAYSQIARLVIRQDEFEKTPKRSIKRYLYW
jgi:long-chain acyl-CoA synthetase